MTEAEIIEHNRETDRKSIIYSLMRGDSRAAACRSARVAPRTFYNWLKDPDFLERVQAAERERVENAESIGYKCAVKALDDPRYLRALFFFLKCKAGWSEKPLAQNPIETVPSVPSTGGAPSTPDSVGAQRAAPVSLPDGNSGMAQKPVEIVPSDTPAGSSTRPDLQTSTSPGMAQNPVETVPSGSGPASPIQNPQSKIQNQSVPSSPGSAPAALNSSIVNRHSSMDEPVPSGKNPPSAPTRTPASFNPKSQNLKSEPNRRAANRNRNKSRKR